jgi:cell division protein FtsN
VRVARAAPPAKPQRAAAPAQMAGQTSSSRPYPYGDQAVFTAGPAPSRPIEVVPSTTAVAEAAPGPAYRIQAGAFSEETRARRAAAQLAAMGDAVIEPVQRGGATFYRVVLPGPQDQLQAYNLRKRVVDAGFADAKVLGPF